MVLIMHKYRLLVTDVDGTLLDHNSKLTELNKKALTDCIKNGIDVTIATGKTIDSIMFIIRELCLTLPQITMNGAVIVTPEGKILDTTGFPLQLYLEFIRDVRSKGYEPTVATVDGKIYCKEYSQNMKHMLDVGEKITKVDDIESDFFIKNTVSISVPMLATDPMDNYIRKKFGKVLQVVRSGEYFFDILNLKASKGNALKKLIKELGIKKEEVVAFGDSHNDISLFKESGCKIAVKNSFPELIEIADIVADENYKSGLGKAIYEHILF
ncbi:MAG: Cof-type HAD-IIB family hydrolase [Actinomycetota bacterium]|nr:Cof-type HAD-IIB family hydrolase [Actinomycetota bacterium]